MASTSAIDQLVSMVCAPWEGNVETHANVQKTYKCGKQQPMRVDDRVIDEDLVIYDDGKS